MQFVDQNRNQVLRLFQTGVLDEGVAACLQEASKSSGELDKGAIRLVWADKSDALGIPPVLLVRSNEIRDFFCMGKYLFGALETHKCIR